MLDLVKWTGQWFVECEADMRFFFLAAKLAELPPQLPPPPAPSSGSLLLVLPAPHQAAPLPLQDLAAFLPALSNGASSATASIVAPPAQPGAPPTVAQVPIACEPTGVLLYLNSAHYDSGTTALVGWVPLTVEKEEDRSREGVGRLLELVEGRVNRGDEVHMFDAGLS